MVQSLSGQFVPETLASKPADIYYGEACKTHFTLYKPVELNVAFYFSRMPHLHLTVLTTRNET